jgi:hypothetical protein
MKIVKFTNSVLVTIFSLVLVFHVLVIIGIIDYSIVWGGRMKNWDEMIIFESISIFLNLFFLLIVSVNASILKIDLSKKLIKVTLWIMLILFSLNTLGNLASKSSLETQIFTPVTFILAIGVFILIWKRRKNLN